MGEWLMDGEGGFGDPSTARMAFTLIGHEDEQAAAHLAILWQRGLGGPADEDEAKRWYEAARRNDYAWEDDDRWRRVVRPRGKRQ